MSLLMPNSDKPKRMNTTSLSKNRHIDHPSEDANDVSNNRNMLPPSSPPLPKPINSESMIKVLDRLGKKPTSSKQRKRRDKKRRSNDWITHRGEIDDIETKDPTMSSSSKHHRKRGDVFQRNQEIPSSSAADDVNSLPAGESFKNDSMNLIARTFDGLSKSVSPDSMVEEAHNASAESSSMKNGIGSVDDIGLEIGYFSGETIYRNRIDVSKLEKVAMANPSASTMEKACRSTEGQSSFNESLQDGHVSISNLIMAKCTAALVTTFQQPNVDWLYNLFPTTTEDLIIISPEIDNAEATNSTKSGEGCDKSEQRKVGDAKMVPIRPDHRSRHRHDHRHRTRKWNFIHCQPHTGGCLHGKLFLFRSDSGLRIVVSGNNFYEWQLCCERDCLWIQDFPITNETNVPGCGDILQNFPNTAGSKITGGNSEFKVRLMDYLQSISECRQSRDQAVVNDLLQTLFKNIDLSQAKARLVYSFPRPVGGNNRMSITSHYTDHGGWKHLANAVHDLLVLDYDTTDDDSSDDDDVSCHL